MNNLEPRQTLIDMRSGIAEDLQSTIASLCKDDETTSIDLLHYTTSLEALEKAGVLKTDKKVRLLLLAPGGFCFEDAVALHKALRVNSNIVVRVLDRQIHEQKIHTKLCILKRRDNKDLAVLGSANFTGAGHGLNLDVKETNIELSVLLFANDAIGQHFEHFWEMEDLKDFDPSLFLRRDLCHEALIEQVMQSPIHRLLKYQEDAVEKLGALYRRKKSGALLSLPTGSGKTVTVLRFLAEHVLRDHNLQKPILWLSHNDTLNRQSLGAAHRLLPKVFPQVRIQAESEYVQSKKAGYRRKNSVEAQEIDLVFSMPKTEKKRPFSQDGYSCIVVDEAHYGSGEEQILGDVLKENEGTFHLGITATPFRSIDRVSVSNRFGNNLVPEVSLDNDELVKYVDRRFGSVQVLAKTSKSLPPVKVPFKIEWDDVKDKLDSDDPLNTFDNPDACKGVSEAWNNAYGQTLVFAIKIEHANNLARAFSKSHGPNLKLQVAHSGLLPRGLNLVVEPTDRIPLNLDQRERVRRDFLKKNITVLISVDLFIAGMDFPKVETVFMSRPTFSSLRYNQMIGRGLRGPQFGGTENLRVIDFCDQGDAHEKSTKYLMTLDKAKSGEDEKRKVYFEVWLKKNSPKVVLIQDADKLPVKCGIWAACSPKGKSPYRDWPSRLSGDINTQVSKRIRKNKKWPKKGWIAYYQFDKAGDPEIIKMAIKKKHIQEIIEKKGQEAVEKRISKNS